MLDAALLLDTGLERTLVGKGASLALVLEHAELVTGVGHGLQAQNLDASEGPASVTARPLGSSMARTRP